MVAITPKTELSAVNLILRNAGETPVNSLTGEVPLEASQARETLIEVSEDVQSRGWYFNTEVYKLSPDNNGNILLPQNALSVRSEGASRNIPVTVRGRKLYNMTPLATGDVFTGPMVLSIVFGLDFEELPAVARRYIALRAARVFQVRETSDELNAQEDSQDEQRALAELHAEQLVAQPVSLRQSWAVQDVVSRIPSGTVL
ncbi:hypothetical protein [Mesorhizobium sp.]|uniref:hypothetical protein n=1 Tax=Mesorhizobium sp. TaxID=1871066 RepID=UPI000FE78883|nr:hypothetical protein [Mesorhizobium sp.]RWM84312.1 MAG: hypothetical protein EOR83_16955 [Mesorhizobium sp.]